MNKMGHGEWYFGGGVFPMKFNPLLFFLEFQVVDIFRSFPRKISKVPCGEEAAAFSISISKCVHRCQWVNGNLVVARDYIVESHAGWYTCCFSMEFSFFIALLCAGWGFGFGWYNPHQKLNIEIPGSAHFDILFESGFLYKNSPRSRRIMSIRFFFFGTYVGIK